MRATYNEHELEPIPGIPGRLPDGEVLLWQGRPGWRGIARRVMHLRLLALYFVVVAAWRAAALAAEGADATEVLTGGGFLLLLGLVPLALLGGYAWLSAKGTTYSLTSRRLIIQTGIALPITIGVPFTAIASAALARHADGTGDISVSLLPEHRVSWIALWPSTRPWRYARVEPMLRALTEPEAVATLLGRTLAGAAATPMLPVPAAEPGHAAPRPAAEAMA